MRISELSREVGVPAATIKYYVREGLLPAGRRESETQSAYDQEHVHRLRLIVALTQVAGLSLADTRTALAGLDGHEQVQVMRTAQEAATREPPSGDEEELAGAEQFVQDLLTGLGWEKAAKPSPQRRRLVAAVDSLQRLGHTELLTAVPEWAAAAERIAAADLASVGGIAEHDRLAESVILGVVIGGDIVQSLRLLAETEQATLAKPRHAADEDD